LYFNTCAFVGIVYKTVISLSKYFGCPEVQWRSNSSLERGDCSFSHCVLFVPVERALRYILDRRLTGRAPVMIRTPWRSWTSQTLIPFLDSLAIYPKSLYSVIKTEIKFSAQGLMKARLLRSVIKTLSLVAEIKFSTAPSRVYIGFL